MFELIAWCAGPLQQTADIAFVAKAADTLLIAMLQSKHRGRGVAAPFADGSTGRALDGDDRIFASRFEDQSARGAGDEVPASWKFGVVRRTGPKFLSELCNFAFAKFRVPVSA